jgi:hypothetical protein
MSEKPAAPERPTRLLAMFTARPVTREEIPRLIEFCSKAYGEETPGASLRLIEAVPDQPIFRIEATPGVMLKESEIILRLHTMDDPMADYPAILARFRKLDEEIGQLAVNSIEGAQSYLALIGTKLLEQGRIRSYLNAGALIGSALGAMFLDPAAVMVTPDPGEWAEACEQSLSIEGAMASAKQP